MNATFTVPSGDRRLRRDATEGKILDATAALLDEGASLAELSVGRIVAAAGVSRATFYLHFTDKRALIARLAARELSAFDEATDAFFEVPDAGRAELASTVRGVVELWRDHAGVLSSLIELAEYDADARATWRATVEAIARSVEIALRARRRDLTSAQAATLAQTIAWAGERACHQMVGRDASTRQVAKVADALTDLIWRAIAPAA